MLISCANALGAGGFARGKVKVPTTNPGAEQGSTTAWTVTNGFTVGQDNPASGAWHFKGGPNSPSSASQELDISAYSTEIDESNQSLSVTWQQGHGGNSSTGTIEAQFMDVADADLGEPYQLVETAPTTYTERTYTVNPVPVGSRKVRITMKATKVGGGDNDAFFDDILVETESGGAKLESVVAPTVTNSTTTTLPVRAGHNAGTDNGTWSQTPDSYLYQWYRDGSPVTDAIAATYVMQKADLDTSLTCKVAAEKNGLFSPYVVTSNSLTPTVKSGPEYQEFGTGSWSSGILTITSLNGVAISSFNHIRIFVDGITGVSSSFMGLQKRTGGTWYTSTAHYMIRLPAEALANNNNSHEMYADGVRNAYYGEIECFSVRTGVGNVLTWSGRNSTDTQTNWHDQYANSGSNWDGIRLNSGGANNPTGGTICVWGYRQDDQG